MNKKLIHFGTLFVLIFMLMGFFSPTFVLAQEPTLELSGCFAIDDANTFSILICRIGNILNSVIPILITLAVIYFIWGVIHYAISHDEEGKTGAKQAMIWGLIALMVIVSVWGLVNFMKGFIGIGDDNTINVPCIPGAPGSGIDCPQTE